MISKFRTITKMFVLLQMLDFLTTLVGLVYLGLWEGNPMVNFWGWETLILVKLLVCVMVATFLEKRSKNAVGEFLIMFIPVSVVFWNMSEITLKIITK
jgi:hypothetical protein